MGVTMIAVGIVAIIILLVLLIGSLKDNDDLLEKNQELHKEILERTKDYLRLKQDSVFLTTVGRSALVELLNKEIKRLKEEKRDYEGHVVWTIRDVEKAETKLGDIDQMIRYYKTLKERLI